MEWSTAKEWIRKHPLESVLGGLVAFILLVAVLAAVFSGGEDDATAAPSTSPIDVGAVSTTTSDTLPEDLLLVEPVECASLLTFDEVEVALGLDQVAGPSGLFVFNRGEVCVHTPDPDQNNFVRTEPGHPNDFEAGATVAGVPGEAIEGVGNTALWFRGTDPESGADLRVISVAEETTLGWLYFRVAVAREGADEPTMREAVRTLALAALPRFPGVVTEPELVEFEPGSFDPALSSHMANLDAKVEGGEWTLGEGLRATLQALTGQQDAADVFLNPDLIQEAAVSVVVRASEFAASEPDDPASEEIEILLGEMFPLVESLRELGAIAQPTASARNRVHLRRILAQEEPDDPDQAAKQEAYCQEVWGTSAPCLVEFPLSELEAEYPGKYQLLVPFVTTQWDPSTPADAAEAITASAELYESIGTMPEVQVVFTPNPGSAIFPMFPKETQCQVALGTNAGSGEEFKQRVAVTLAYCLIYESLGNVWAEDGLAWYLGALVFDDVDLEHEWADDLQNEELSTTIVDRRYTNWSLFEFIHTLPRRRECRVQSRSWAATERGGLRASVLPGTERLPGA